MKIKFILFTLCLLSLHLMAENSNQSEGIMNRLFAPGPLTKGHSALEGSQCLKCHESGKGISNSKCFSCHKDIKAFVDRKTGFHGMRNDSCIQCHSDHKGRTYDSTQIDENKFDHQKTGFSLNGKHSQVSCKSCHTEFRGQNKLRSNEIRYMGSHSTCISCHKKDDIHFFKGNYLKKDCNTCHNVNGWKNNVQFNHQRDGHFELIGKHAELSCQKCHNPEQNKIKTNLDSSIYKWPHLEQKKCLSCHDNFHKNNLSPQFQNGQCTTCHSQKTWKIPNFNHEVTQFILKGKHSSLNCSSCHQQSPVGLENKKDKPNENIKWRGLNQQCLSCHKDYHQFNNHRSTIFKAPNKCLTCHDESSWNEIHDFNHNANTRFKIDGQHKKYNCKSCHLPQTENMKSSFMNPLIMNLKEKSSGIYHWKSLNEKTCSTCHTNIHIGAFSPNQLQRKCTDCHTTEGWQVINKDINKNFDHNTTRFPLTGKHSLATCTQCHIRDNKKVYRFNNSIKKDFCIECHDNVHLKQFSPQFSDKSCKECHSTESFTQRGPFNHNETRYKLMGSHEKLACQSCHTLTKNIFPTQPPHFMSQFIFKNLNKDQCLTCHKDIHMGQLSRNCDQCHDEMKWKSTKFNHQLQSRFILNGQHEILNCNECHQNIPNQFVLEFNKKIPVTQFKPIGTECETCHTDVHKGRFGNQCSSCHSETNWPTTKNFHKDFSLSGTHFSLQCQECHSQNKKLSGLSLDCQFCHKKDDIHSGTLPRCGECHQQQFWENTRFNHSLSLFPLRGAHRVAQCQDCHSQGVYQGRSTDCYDCHRSDALRATGRPHSDADRNCVECHTNQFSFKSFNPR